MAVKYKAKPPETHAIKKGEAPTHEDLMSLSKDNLLEFAEACDVKPKPKATKDSIATSIIDTYDGEKPTVFYFKVNAALRIRINCSWYNDPERDIEKAMQNLFRTALYAWDNYIDGETGDQIKFSIFMRDMTVDTTEIFNEADYFKIWSNTPDEESEKPDAKKTSPGRKTVTAEKPADKST